jgi:hypothetical protein
MTQERKQTLYVKQRYRKPYCCPAKKIKTPAPFFILPTHFHPSDFEVLLLKKPGRAPKASFSENQGYQWYSQKQVDRGAWPVPVLPERARSECARSTAAAGTSQAPL